MPQTTRRTRTARRTTTTAISTSAIIGTHPIDRRMLFASDAVTTSIEESWAVVSVEGDIHLRDGARDHRAQVRIRAHGSADGSEQRVSLLGDVTTGALGENFEDRDMVGLDDMRPGALIALWRALGVAVAKAQRLGLLPTEPELDAATADYFAECRRHNATRKVAAAGAKG